jgi:hypothetical protein
MNLEHFGAFVWLRWRMRRNQMRRGGTLNAVFVSILSVLGILFGLGAFVGLLLFGIYIDRTHISPMHVFDALIVGFIFSWVIGLLSDLQRSEVLTLSKFLHLPVSLGGAFFINYLSTLASLTLMIFLPIILGFAIGLLLAKGPALLLIFPALLALLFMVTALTHQFQGWLASMMTNPRRRRMVVGVITITMVGLGQSFNLAHWFFGSGKNKQAPAAFRQVETSKNAPAGGNSNVLSKETEGSLELMNQVLPFLWPARAARDLTQGKILFALLATIGLASVGTASLWRSYRTTVRLYTGDFTSGKTTDLSAPAKVASPAKVSAAFVERTLPWISEHAAAIAFASFRSLMRAPEVRLMLIAPMVVVLMFSIGIVRGAANLPDGFRPLLVFGGMAAVILSLSQLTANQFGFDRNGFRVFVLCPARRRDILLGKNLAVVPLALPFALILAVVCQVVHPLRFDRFLAFVPQALMLYLLYSIQANCISIIAPLAISPGSMKATNVKLLPVLLHIVSFFLLPLLIAPVLIPFGAESVIQGFGWGETLPISLFLSLLLCPVVMGLYYLVLTLQGAWLQAREKTILDVVTSKIE